MNSESDSEPSDPELQMVRLRGSLCKRLSLGAREHLKKIILILVLSLALIIIMCFNANTPEKPPPIPEPIPVVNTEPQVQPWIEPEPYIPSEPIKQVPPEPYESNLVPATWLKLTRAVRDKFLPEILKVKVDLNGRTDKMLIGISSADFEIERRSMLRFAQFNPHRKFFNITFRFVIGEPDLAYVDYLKYENDTYGDLIMLKNFSDSRYNARTLKPFEFFRYVENNLPMYKYVGKLDSDCYVNLADFTRDFFNITIQDSDDDFTIIALFIKGWAPFNWPQGGFEVVSWKTMLILNRLFDYIPFKKAYEDTQIGAWLYDAQINYTMIDLTDERAYDFRKSDHPHAETDIYPYTVRLHELKIPKDYLQVAKCFDDNGVNMTEVNIRRNANWTI